MELPSQVSEAFFQVLADPTEQQICAQNTQAISTFQEVGGGAKSTARDGASGQSRKTDRPLDLNKLNEGTRFDQTGIWQVFWVKFSLTVPIVLFFGK